MLAAKKVVHRKSKKKYRNDFKSDVRAATTIISSVAALQRLGLIANAKNIRLCIIEKCRKPVHEILPTVPHYLNKAWRLGILKKTGGGFKIEDFKVRKPRLKRTKLTLSKDEEPHSEGHHSIISQID